MDARRRWSLFTALGCIALLVVGYMFLIKPQNSHAASLRAQTASVQSGTAQLRVKLATLQAESRNLAGEQAKLDRIVRQLPPGPELPALTRELDRVAAGSHVDLVNLSPGTAAPFTPTVGAATAPRSGTAVAPASVTLMTVPVTLSVSGEYFNLERFLDSLESLQRSMLVDGFSVTYQGTKAAAASGTPQPNSGELNVSIQARVFQTSGPLAAPSAAAAPAAK